MAVAAVDVAAHPSPTNTRMKSAASPPSAPCPQLKKFVESGGSIVTVGSSTSVAEALGLPVKNFLTEMGADGKEQPSPAR